MNFLKQLQVCRGLPTAARTSNTTSKLPPSQNRQSATLFPGHTEILQTISAQRGGHPVATAQRPLRTKTQGLSPHHLDAGTPQDLRRVQGEFVTATLLTHSDPSAPLARNKDASASATGAALQQYVKTPGSTSPSQRNSTRSSKNKMPITTSCWPSTRFYSISATRWKRATSPSSPTTNRSREASSRNRTNAH
jgi:hypothetical protein